MVKFNEADSLSREHDRCQKIAGWFGEDAPLILLFRISAVGQNAPDYWKYGCYFREQKSNTRVRFDSAFSPGGAGSIPFSAWGEQARDVLERLLAEAQRLTPGQRPQPEWFGQVGPGSPTGRELEEEKPAGLEGLRIEDRRVFISYPWGTQDFGERIVPITLSGAGLFTLEQRLDAMEFWKAKVEKLQPRAHLLRGDDHDLFERMRDWSLNLQDLLSHVAGKLHPTCYEDAEADDFALVRRMLER